MPRRTQTRLLLLFGDPKRKGGDTTAGTLGKDSWKHTNVEAEAEALLARPGDNAEVRGNYQKTLAMQSDQLANRTVSIAPSP